MARAAFLSEAVEPFSEPSGSIGSSSFAEADTIDGPRLEDITSIFKSSLNFWSSLIRPK